MSTPMLEIKDLVKVYGTGASAKTAVEHISLTVQKGAFFGLLGPNGAGKSTTIHCITGIAQPMDRVVHEQQGGGADIRAVGEAEIDQQVTATQVLRAEGFVARRL